MAVPLPRAFSPLRHRVFRTLWLATLASNTGMWVQNTGAGWLMTSLDPSPFMVSMVQAASMLPVFLLALPAGALADIVDRRRFLIGAQLWMLLMAALLALLAATDALGPWGLLAITFGIGAGTAINFPAWAATTPELVPRDDLVGAVALNGIGFNLARAVGPALGGFAIAAAGPEAAFALNAFAFLLLIVALIAWRRPPDRRNTLPKEHLVGAMRAGLRFVAASPAMQAAILRACAFFLPAAAVWGLLPLLVRGQLGLGPEAFGLMLGVMGASAVGAGFVLPFLRARMDRGALVFRASLVVALAMGLLALSEHWLPAALSMALYGAAWIAAGSTLAVSAQVAAPAWVRARAIAIYQLSFFGMMAFGAALAGWIGARFGVAPALAAASLGGMAIALAVRPWRLDPAAAREGGGAAAAVPVPEAPAAELEKLLGERSGRVLEVVRYRVDPADRAAFLDAMREVRRVRLRSGALTWRLYEDVAHPERWAEFWAVGNWTEHLREAQRLTDDDLAALARAAALHRAEAPPEASRYLNVPP
ncbi:MFS transporter [Craurococcus roseus]|uniref:MFS transporter n=1 Tax=Craurococcus roseus TaxID=77585 RepID=A0ABP3QBQ8_9PROT